jgi:2-polyprenyl-3-methyl-5-hydroxy-6-metoxy-1,4-benzoquinol methylase
MTAEYDVESSGARVQPNGGVGAPAPRYDFEIDLAEDTTHTAIVAMVGRDRRVLELGTATGYMSKVFAAQGCTVVGVELDPEMAAAAEPYCERMIVGDLDVLDLDSELGVDRFDAIVAADVLEHLKDPLALLRRLKPFLEPEGGFFVASVPNIAHGSVRLALLEGRFAYQEHGLLDRTHLRFFTRDTIEELFEDAELGIVEISRRELNVDAAEVPFSTGNVPDAVMEAINSDVDARTYQFVVKALPFDAPGLKALRAQLRGRAYELDEKTAALKASARELDEAREQLAVVDDLRRAVAELAAREHKIRASLIDTHDQLLRRDAQIKELNVTVAELRRVEAERDQLAAQNEELYRAQDEARKIILVRDEEIRMLRTRLSRITSSLPMRVWSRVAGLPLVNLVRARRTAAYRAELARRSAPDRRDE